MQCREPDDVTSVVLRLVLFASVRCRLRGMLYAYSALSCYIRGSRLCKRTVHNRLT